MALIINWRTWKAQMLECSWDIHVLCVKAAFTARGAFSKCRRWYRHWGWDREQPQQWHISSFFFTLDIHVSLGRETTPAASKALTPLPRYAALRLIRPSQRPPASSTNCRTTPGWRAHRWLKIPFHKEASYNLQLYEWRNNARVTSGGWWNSHEQQQGVQNKQFPVHPEGAPSSLWESGKESGLWLLHRVLPPAWPEHSARSSISPVLLSHVSEPTQNADHGQGLGNPLKHPIAFAPNWYSDPEVEPDAKNHACSASVQEIQVTWNTVLSDLTTYIWAPKLDWSTSSSFLGCPIQVPKLFNWLYLSLWSHSKGLD